jgi:hypothetical protein
MRIGVRDNIDKMRFLVKIQDGGIKGYQQQFSKSFQDKNRYPVARTLIGVIVN